MPSKHKLLLKRNKHREKAVAREAEQVQRVLGEIDRTLDRLVSVLTSLERAKTSGLLHGLSESNLKS